MVDVDAGIHGPSSHKVPLARVSPEDYLYAESLCGRQSAAPLESFAKLAVAASVEAVADARLSPAILDQRTAVIFGHGTGGMETLEAGYARFFGMKSPRMHPMTIPRVMLSSPSSAVAMHHGVHGPTFATSSACSSSGHAIMMGALMISTGLVDAAVVGGSESLATSGMLRCWEAMHAMSQASCRPFSVDRDGMVIGEGAAALVLQADDKIDDNATRIYGELVGFGSSSDSFHLTQPALAGAVDSIRQASRSLIDRHHDAKVLVSAHGTGTPLNDINEARALESVLDGSIPYVVSATKSIHGHLLGGSTALQVVIGLQALNAQCAPGIANVETADPACRIPLVLGKSVEFAATHLLANSFAFGGLNVSLLFSGTSHDH